MVLLVLVLFVGCMVPTRSLPFVVSEDPFEVTGKHQLFYNGVEQFVSQVLRGSHRNVLSYFRFNSSTFPSFATSFHVRECNMILSCRCLNGCTIGDMDSHLLRHFLFGICHHFWVLVMHQLQYQVWLAVCPFFL
jgi:hypothetical protein